ncbi:MAG TPA: S41 family peptidase [Candidatus Dormibacteraeota bacterium]|nr:S41 family peptidase [Candidatus Dormibacteraeota bacterium]
MNVRTTIIALLVAVLVAAGALYVGNRSGAFGTQNGLPLRIAASGSIGDLFGGPSDDQLVGIALMQLERAYYKPIDPQTPFRGVTSALVSYLHTRHIVAKLPAERATGNPAVDASRLETEVAYAQSHYGAAAGRDQILEQALTGMMSSVDDPYTVYLSPREIQQLTETLNGGNFGGIGVYIFPLRNREILLQPIEGLPAERAGMKVPLILDRVNGTRAGGLSSDGVQALIRGRAGTTVTIQAHPIQAPKSVRTFRIVREIIHVPTVHAKMENGFDYIRLSEFGETSASEIHAALLDGRARGAKGYILDLRDNGGGLVDSAVAIVSYFVARGATVVSEVDRAGRVAPQYADGATIAGLHPLVILVNKYTASASEITAGALQDYHLATLVGTQTFGKGVVQSIYVMPGNQGALKITIARYVTPSGRDIEHRGIRPDIIVNQSPDPRLIDTPADKQLAAAKARLRQLANP